ncbi:hypothetical protein C427_3805 [Paraglaciecola psychrophila 170]|uniref:Uncharacterized protein n=1 Tax=Paraglaciecola psychrophila 170 TaxID=1129794 RepID=K6ZND8_9ALTE|nr:hypothetical protein C427_3805 [Paraglaciecola psychrophila 170]GAC37471.1 hypothetical protein GPSY_1847 [Paraglaciecola psychrophila 170]
MRLDAFLYRCVIALLITKYLALPINNRINVNIRLIEDTKFQTKKPDRK